ncbi:MFS transporter [Streptomyces sp. 7N604]|uniref:MFS transporter n=1 Tax=Streptomyces sp. 7N604 TaxID=3457415 RepID=UPI003FD640C0
MPTRQSVDHSPAGRREWIGLALLSLPAMLVSMDLTVLHLAVPALSMELGPSSSQLLWIVDVYGFMIAGFLVTMGTLGDRIGRRRLLLIGAAGFGVASVLAAFATSAELLIAARALLGISGATLAPSTVSLIRHMFRDPQQRTRAISLWFMSFMAGSAIGPLVGGALLEFFWWGAAFLIGVPVMLLLLSAGPTVLPEYRDPQPGRLDLTSAMVALVAVLSGMYGLKKVAESGLTLWPVLAMAAGALGCLLFVQRQRTTANPLIDVTLFRRNTVRVALLALTVGAVAVGGIGYLTLQHLQLVFGLAPFEAGVWTLPPFLAGAVTTVLVPTLAQRVGQASVLAGGMALAALGLAALALLGGTGAELVIVIGALVFLFGGLMPVLALGVDVVVGAAPAERTGAASAITETTQELGIALGIALLGSSATFVYRQGMDGVLPHDAEPSEAAEAARSTLGGAKGAASELPAEVLTAAGQAFTDGLRVAAAVSAAVLAMGAAVVAAVLRRVPTDTATRERPAASPVQN